MVCFIASLSSVEPSFVQSCLDLRLVVRCAVHRVASYVSAKSVQLEYFGSRGAQFSYVYHEVEN